MSHMVYCFAYAMSQQWLVYNHGIWDKTNGQWYGTEGFLGQRYMPGTQRAAYSVSLDPDGCMVRGSEGHCFAT